VSTFKNVCVHHENSISKGLHSSSFATLCAAKSTAWQYQLLSSRLPKVQNIHQLWTHIPQKKQGKPNEDAIIFFSSQK